ncbi:MAG: type VI secretion system tube protein Hcp [Planctomycetaceae bacterium]|jgi:type VI secretion system secreted protein Hcp|nr:type VI secretion system tube protein Hcp [Planctomycetaceae bacterium]
MAIYIQIEGVEGTVTEEKHDKWIEVHNCNFSTLRHVEATAGKVADRANNKPTFSEVAVSKNYDAASPKLFAWTTKGETKKVTIHFTKDDNNTFVEIILTDVLCSNYTFSGLNMGDPSETLSFNFTKIEIKRIPYDSKNKAGTPIPVGYDLATMKPC